VDEIIKVDQVEMRL